MNTENNEFNEPSSTLVNSEGIAHLHGELLSMMSLVQHQLTSSMQALIEGDTELAQSVIDTNAKVKEFEIDIDNEVLHTISHRNPSLDKELRTMIAISKIVAELEKFGGEITNFSEFVIVLYDPNTSDPNHNLLKDIIKIGDLVTVNLAKLLQVLANQDSKLAYTLLETDRDYELELQEGIRNQLDLVVHNVRMIGRGLDILQMMKSLERCGEHCRNIAELMILMIDGVDIRHKRNTIK